MSYTPNESNGFSEFRTKPCARCGTDFTQHWQRRRRICTPCRSLPITPEEKARRTEDTKLPRMTRNELLEWLRKGIIEFHNGGTRRRIVVGVEFMILYKSRYDGRTTTGVWQDAFAKWCRGVVLGGVMCDKEGKPLQKGAINDDYASRRN
jgi:hypothetical protein